MAPNLPGQPSRDVSLSQREFDTWRESDTQWKSVVLEHVAEQGKVNREIASKVSALETNQLRAGTLASWVIAVVAAVVSGLTGLFFGRQ